MTNAKLVSLLVLGLLGFLYFTHMLCKHLEKMRELDVRFEEVILSQAEFKVEKETKRTLKFW